ncbi:MAG: radical SAM protein [Anaerolineaceae bacterium]|nr:radical SAM protein [Anaerolineaceae bacterium]
MMNKSVVEDANFLIQNISGLGEEIYGNKPMIDMGVKIAEDYFENAKNKKLKEGRLNARIIQDQTDMGLAIMESIRRLLMSDSVSPATFQALTSVLGRDLLVEKDLREKKVDYFEEHYGASQPSFLLISPTKACNLHCTGCYADSDENVRKLDYDIFSRLVNDAREEWGAQFMVISGGEPMVYKSQGKTILDMAAENPKSYFIFFTNGTLITPEAAHRMAELGNIAPMFSLEGWKQTTDKRRGTGVFDKVMQSMDLLRKEGVIFGTSLTATKDNYKELLSDEFMDFLVLEKGVSLAWVFHYMPIGRSYTLELMPSPEARLWMWRKSWEMIREKRYFIADFWNGGSVVDGCLSAGGHDNGGYMYIDWDGHISPCVFVPYSPVNINDIYAKGGSLDDIWNAPFFKGLREFQSRNKDEHKGSHVINPCPIRDHNSKFRQIFAQYEPDPIDKNAEEAMSDPDYAKGLDKYGDQYQKIVDKLWKKVYEDNQEPTEALIDTISAQSK